MLEQNLTDVNDLIKRRYEELDELIKNGVLPYEYSFDVDSNSTDIIQNFKEM